MSEIGASFNSKSKETFCVFTLEDFTWSFGCGTIASNLSLWGSPHVTVTREVETTEEKMNDV